jgi:hypothetical protein
MASVIHHQQLLASGSLQPTVPTVPNTILQSGTDVLILYKQQLENKSYKTIEEICRINSIEMKETEIKENDSNVSDVKRQRTESGYNMMLTSANTEITSKDNLNDIIKIIHDTFKSNSQLDENMLRKNIEIINNIIRKTLVTGTELRSVINVQFWEILQVYRISEALRTNNYHPTSAEILEIIYHYLSIPAEIEKNNLLHILSQYIKEKLYLHALKSIEIEKAFAKLFIHYYDSNACKNTTLLFIPLSHPINLGDFRKKLIETGMHIAEPLNIALRHYDKELYDAIVMHTQDEINHINCVSALEILNKIKIENLERLVLKIGSSWPSIVIQACISRKVNNDILLPLIDRYASSVHYPLYLLDGLFQECFNEEVILLRMHKITKLLPTLNAIIIQLLKKENPISRKFTNALLCLMDSISADIVYMIHAVYPGLLDESHNRDKMNISAFNRYSHALEPRTDNRWGEKAWAIFATAKIDKKLNKDMPIEIIVQHLISTWNINSDESTKIYKKNALQKGFYYLVMYCMKNEFTDIYNNLDKDAQIDVLVNSINTIVDFSITKYYVDKLATFIIDHIHDNPLPIETMLKLKTLIPSVIILSRNNYIKLFIQCTGNISPVDQYIIKMQGLRPLEQAIIIEKYKDNDFYPISVAKSNKRYRLEWISNPSWNQFCKILNMVDDDLQLVIENGNGIDAGGPRREFYSKLSNDIQKCLFTKIEGYLMPRMDLSDKEIEYLVKLLHRLVFIDYIRFSKVNMQCVRPELDLHPVLLIMMTLPHITTAETPWEIVTWLLGDWLKEYSPQTFYSKIFSNIYHELNNRYMLHFSVITKIGNAFKKSHPLTPRILQYRLVGEKILLDDLLDKLRVVENKDAKYYLDVFKLVLKSLDEDKITELFKFWFGTERADYVHDFPLLQLFIAPSNNLRNIHSHSCANQLDIPKLVMPDNALPSPDALFTDMNTLLLAALENQRRSESINWLFQII